MRKAAVYNHGRMAGLLTEVSPSEFVFRYDDAYFWLRASIPPCGFPQGIAAVFAVG